MYIYIYASIYVYIYMYIEREREFYDKNDGDITRYNGINSIEFCKYNIVMAIWGRFSWEKLNVEATMMGIWYGIVGYNMGHNGIYHQSPTMVQFMTISLFHLVFLMDYNCDRETVWFGVYLNMGRTVYGILQYIVI
jgi:hypothetical protein